MQNWSVVDPQFARGFAWFVGDDGQTFLGIRHPRTKDWLALVSHGTKEGSGAELPLTDVEILQVDTNKGGVTTSTTHVALLGASSALDKWRGCTSLRYQRDSILLNWASEHGVLDVHGDGGFNMERMEILQPGWVLVSPDYAANGKGWNEIPVTEYLEPHPLGRAEWMVALAWLSGDSVSGARAFQDAQRDYLNQVRTATKDVSIMTGSVADGVWHAPGHDSFVAQWIHDAGGRYALQSANADGNIALDLESLLLQAVNTDVWVMVTYDPDSVTTSELLAMDPRHEALVHAVQEVWVCNTAVSDYFGALVVHPDWMLADLEALMQGEDIGPHVLLRRLKPNP